MVKYTRIVTRYSRHRRHSNNIAIENIEIEKKDIRIHLITVRMHSKSIELNLANKEQVQCTTVNNLNHINLCVLCAHSPIVITISFL